MLSILFISGDCNVGEEQNCESDSEVTIAEESHSVAVFIHIFSSWYLVYCQEGLTNFA